MGKGGPGCGFDLLESLPLNNSFCVVHLCLPTIRRDLVTFTTNHQITRLEMRCEITLFNVLVTNTANLMCCHSLSSTHVIRNPPLVSAQSAKVSNRSSN